VLTIDASWDPRLEPYWDPPRVRQPAPRRSTSIDDAARDVRFLLRQAVERRLVADVPLGAFLSGGLDSSAIVGMMAGLSSRPVKTFTIGFDRTSGFDERTHAALVAKRFDTELSELTRKHVTVALAGDGGDELFGGYERFAAAVAISHLPSPIRMALAAGADVIPPWARRGAVGRIVRLAHPARQPLPDSYLDWVAFLPSDLRRGFVGDGVAEPGIREYRGLWESTRGSTTIERLLDLNLRTYLLDDLLPKVDRMAMAHALEVRSPFLDHELVEFALALPPGASRHGLSLKRVLKHAMRGFLPDEIIDRPKHGFGVPLDQWFRGSLGAYVSSTLGSAGARVRAHLRPAAIDTLLAQHAGGRHNHGNPLWTLLTLEVFLRANG
jgi:asparagine synthase (glutamine-hydrolysing)